MEVRIFCTECAESGLVYLLPYAIYVIGVQCPDNQCVFMRQNAFGGQTRDKNSHTKRKTIKPFQKNYTEMSGTLFVPHPLVLLVPRIES